MAQKAVKGDIIKVAFDKTQEDDKKKLIFSVKKKPKKKVDKKE